MANFKEFVATGEEPVGKYMEFSVEVLPDGVTSAIPDGWEICNGSAVSRNEYADLFAIIGETFGPGDGSSTFNLPDLRGKFLRGSGGNSSAIGTTQSDAFKSHDHPASATSVGNHDHGMNATGNHSHSYNDKFGRNGLGGETAEGKNRASTSRNNNTGSAGNHSHNIYTGGAHGHTITVNNRGDSETRPINMSTVICIKV
jgi:microcystin-dependent protein